MRLDRQRLLGVGAVIVILGLGAFALASALPVFVDDAPSDDTYATATAEIEDSETGRPLGTVVVHLATTQEQRYTGLSDTPTLSDGRGMLFVYEREEPRTYVMREMDYPLDIVFVGANRRINAIRRAPAPGPNEDGTDIRRSGSAKWVLEVSHGWTAAHNVSRGDRLVIQREGS
jgi:uncharacterized membrane protein (UPF0127 family)